MIMPLCKKQEKQDTIYSKEYYNKPLFIDNESRIEFIKDGLLLVCTFVLLISICCLLEYFNKK